MIFAATTDTDTGRHTLWLGLEEENMRLLRNDQPILKRFDGTGGEPVSIPGLEEWSVVITGPEDTARLRARLAQESKR